MECNNFKLLQLLGLGFKAPAVWPCYFIWHNLQTLWCFLFYLFDLLRTVSAMFHQYIQRYCLIFIWFYFFSFLGKKDCFSWGENGLITHGKKTLRLDGFPLAMRQTYSFRDKFVFRAAEKNSSPPGGDRLWPWVKTE